MQKVLEGNHAISWGAKASDVKVIAAYPITPQTQSLPIFKVGT